MILIFKELGQNHIEIQHDVYERGPQDKIKGYIVRI